MTPRNGVECYPKDKELLRWDRERERERLKNKTEELALDVICFIYVSLTRRRLQFIFKLSSNGIFLDRRRRALSIKPDARIRLHPVHSAVCVPADDEVSVTEPVVEDLRRINQMAS